MREQFSVIIRQEEIQKNYQVDLETLQYDLLYGERYAYGGENPYPRSKMRLGLYDVTLDSLELVSSFDFTYRITGTNFTPSSQVKLNGEWYDTVYISPTTLMITGTELNDFDRLAVIQRSNSSTRKALSKSYDRSCYALYSENKWKLPEGRIEERRMYDDRHPPFKYEVYCRIKYYDWYWTSFTTHI